MSEAKEQRSTLAEAEEKRLLKLDSKVRMTELGLTSRIWFPPLLTGGAKVPLVSAIDGEM